MRLLFRTKGFTLLELLIAISVFSVIGLSAYQMLQSVIASHERVRASSEGYTAVNLAFSIIQRDFNQFVPRPVRDTYGEPLPPILFGNEDMVVEFTRSGWSNPIAKPRSNLQRVAYSVDYDTGELTRHFWTVLDRAEDTKPISRVLLTDVRDFTVSGFAGDGDEDSFTLDESTAAAPLAVEVVISTETHGELRRLFQMVEPFVETASDDRGQDGGEGLPGEDVTGDAENEQEAPTDAGGQQ